MLSSAVVSSSPPSTVMNIRGPTVIKCTGDKRANTVSRNVVKRKQPRLDLANSPGFVEIHSSFNRAVVWYYRRNTENITNHKTFLYSIKSELYDKLNYCAGLHPIKYNLKLEATYNIPDVESSLENRAFKTSAREVFSVGDIDTMLDEDFSLLLAEEDAYTRKGSGFTLTCIDGLLLGVYEYTPLDGSSYIPLPKNITAKKAVINPQNKDQQCFKWAILTKHVTGLNKHRVGENYTIHENKYNFTGLTFPTPLAEIDLFEKWNPEVSVNVYGLKKEFQPLKNFCDYIVFPLKVVSEEKSEHFDLLYITDNEKSHFACISNFSRLIRKQKTQHTEKLFMCKRCFTSFNSIPKKFKLHGQAALDEHMRICGPHKSILPIMPKEGEMVKFESWGKTVRLPFTMYADFEALLVKSVKKIGINTEAFQEHHPMSYGFIVKAADDVPKELLERFNIPTAPIIFRGSEESDKVTQSFVLTMADIANRIYNLLKTNVTIIMSEEQRTIHEEKTECDLCKSGFTNENKKVADHNHLSGKFRFTLCNTCNLKLQKPNFVPCFLHNLSNYDAHFIVTELGYDTHSISVIPNSEEKFISFSKKIYLDFSIRFIDTFRFMSSSLSTLASNLVTSDFSKFRETAKVFTAEDLPLVTRKGVYPYEYTDSWAKLEETCLPRKEEFYSSLTETNINDKDFEHATKVWDHFKCDTLGEYSDLYLKIDVLLLADIFENFRDICISTYHLDPAYYYTAPGFSFDCMLKYTKMKLELLTDYNMLLMIENGIILI